MLLLQRIDASNKKTNAVMRNNTRLQSTNGNVDRKMNGSWVNVARWYDDCNPNHPAKSIFETDWLACYSLSIELSCQRTSALSRL